MFSNLDHHRGLCCAPDYTDSGGTGSPVRGRYAPSPTGMIHVGNARTALAAWLSARSQGGQFIWRVEDIDRPRVLPGIAEAQMEDLEWLGLDWDEGPEPFGGPYAPYEQSERHELYEGALYHLHASGHLFPCRRSRKELAGVASAPHGQEGAPYPASFRPASMEEDWFERLQLFGDASIRFRVPEQEVTFEDHVFGLICERVDQTVGDFVLRRRDGIYAYQLAVVVDDLAMQITEVVRGVDLLDSTARQILLIRALGGTPPVYAHVPLMLNEAGEKLNKRDRALTLRSLRQRGLSAQSIVGFLAYTLGLLSFPEPCRPADLVQEFSWSRIQKKPVLCDTAFLPT